MSSHTFHSRLSRGPLALSGVEGFNIGVLGTNGGSRHCGNGAQSTPAHE